MKLASLFDGSGGFPLAGTLVGIEPVWASEIEPFPIRVTTKRFPNMKHYGDVSKIDGAKVEPVDIITFGSPCQDLSVAGKRAGLEEGMRSNLFYQAVRIIREMRKETRGKYPRYAVWENVPGAYSSNGGDDFKSVLETLAQVEDADVHVPKSDWKEAGLILGDGYSICWRTLDAQYWGVPQRRKRIFLVADFNGWSAEKILFESEGLCRYSAQGFRAWQRLANGAEGGSGESGAIAVDAYNGSIDEKVHALRVNCGSASGSNGVMIENHPADSRVQIKDDGKCQTLDARMGMGGGNTPLVMEQMEQYTTAKTLKMRGGKDGGGKGALVQDEKSATLGCNNDQTLFVPSCNQGGIAIVEQAPFVVDQGAGKSSCNVLKDQSPTLATTHDGAPVVALEGNGSRPSHKGNGFSEDGKSFTLNTIEQHGVAYESEKVFSMTCGSQTMWEEEKANTLFARDFKDPQIINDRKPIGFYPQLKAESVTPLEDKQPCLINGTNPGFQNGVMQSTRIQSYIVRRLTPTECARLQGFPDWWAHDLGTKHATEEEVAFWKDVWNTWNAINGAPPKKESAVKSWLRDPYSDAAEYKMWGNGVALPCVTFILAGIEWAVRTNQEGEEPSYDRQMSIFDF